MLPDDLTPQFHAYFASVPADELGMRLAARRGVLTAAGATAETVARLDSTLVTLSRSGFLLPDYVWAAEQIRDSGEAGDIALAALCVRCVYPAQVLDISAQLDRQHRKGYYGDDVAITHARQMLPWFERPGEDLSDRVFSGRTYDRMDTIAGFVERVIVPLVKREDAYKVQRTADAIRFSNRVLRTL